MMRSTQLSTLLLTAGVQALITADGTCLTPTPQATFDETAYLGFWYEIEGDKESYGSDASVAECVIAEYTLTDDSLI